MHPLSFLFTYRARYYRIHYDVKCYLTLSEGFARVQPVKRKTLTGDEAGNLNLRGVPRATIYRLKMAAAAEHRTVKELLLELIEGKIQELERKGILPKGK